MRPTAIRNPTIPLLCLLLSATACVEEETIDAPESGSLSSVSNNLETPEAAAAEERAEERDEAAAEGDIRSDVAGAAPFYNGYLCSGSRKSKWDYQFLCNCLCSNKRCNPVKSGQNGRYSGLQRCYCVADIGIYYVCISVFLYFMLNYSSA